MSLKQQTFKGVVWSGSEKLGIQGIQFILGIILARLLTPKDFGLLGLLTIFIALAQTFIDSGFSVGLVRKADADDEDFSTVFWFNIFVATLSYIALFIAAPYIADFYDQPILTTLSRVVTISLIINSFGAIQTTILTKKIDFKTMAKVRLFAVTIGGIVGIIMALRGYGVWSLVVKTLVQAVFMNLGFWVGSKWRPAFLFSIKAFLGIFSFGSKLLISAIFTTITGNLYSIVIGKFFSVQELGFYTRAKQFVDLPVQSIQGVSMSVLFPVLSQLQGDDKKLKEGYTRFLRMITFVLFPIMAMLALLAEPIIHILLTDKWLPVVPLLQILVFIGASIPLHSINVNVLIVKGRSDLVLLLDIIKNAILFLTIFITFRWGIYALLWGMLAQSVLVYFIHAHYSNKVLTYSIVDQLKDIRESFFTTIAMAIAVYLTCRIMPGEYLKVILGLIVGMTVYYLINRLSKNNELSEIQGYMMQVYTKIRRR